MAAPAVQTKTEGAVTTAGTSHTVAFPASSASGDLILVIFATAAVQATMSAGDSFSKLQLNPATGNHNLAAFYKQIDGSESGDVVITTGGSTKSAWVVYRITGHVDPVTQAPEKATVATGTGTTPNPPSITPTGGPKDFLYIACFRQDGEVLDDDAQVNSGPSGYTFTAATDGHQKSTGTGGAASSNCLVSGAYLGVTNSTTEDPGTFSVDSATLAWQAQTLAIHPAGGGPTLQTLAVTSTFTPTLADLEIYKRALAVVSTLTAALADLEIYLRTLAVTSAFTTTLNKMMSRVFAVGSTFVAALASSKVFTKLLEVTSAFTPTLAILRNVTLAVASTFSIGFQRLVSFHLAVASTFLAGIQRMFPKVLDVVSTFTATVQRKFFKQFDVLSTLAPVLGVQMIIRRAFETAAAWSQSLATVFIPASGGGPIASIVQYLRRRGQKIK